MNPYVLPLGGIITLIRCLFPPDNGLTTSATRPPIAQVLQIAVLTLVLGYATRPAGTPDPLYAIRRMSVGKPRSTLSWAF